MSKKKSEHGEETPKEETEQQTQPETEQAQQKAAEEPQEQPAAPAPEKPQEDSERYLRLMAEFDNYRKRTEKEKEGRASREINTVIRENGRRNNERL